MAKANDKKGLTDPVKADGAENEIDESVFAVKDGENENFLSTTDIGAIRDRSVNAPHPFIDYREAKKVRVGDDGKLLVSATFLILLKPSEEPSPDRSNDSVLVGGDPKVGAKTKSVKLGTYHTRVVTNRQGNENVQVIFDRDILVADTWYKCAIVKSHAARAQVVYRWDERRNRVMVDNRYLLADTAQAELLLKMFKAIIYQRTGAERNAQEFDDLKESTA